MCIRDRLGVARNTVALAYELLVNEGYLLTKSRSGHFVNPEIVAGRAGRPSPPRASVAPEPARWPQRYRGAVSSLRNIVKPRDWQRYPYPLIYGQIDRAQLPMPGRRGVFVSPDEILVTVGAQHALFMLGTLLVDSGTTVGIENPGYPDARNIFAARTANVVPLPLDDAGLALTPALDRCDYVYLTPSHQCPTNVTMPLARREALLAWA